MAKNYPAIKVVIPTWNNADSIDDTVQSILGQDYPKECIFTLYVDFGSTDDTVKKILSYPKQHTGLLQLPSARWGRTRVAEAWQQYSLQLATGLPVTLFAGDELYPHCFKTAVQVLQDAKKVISGSFLVGEVDIKEKDGNITTTQPLYDRTCFFRGYTDDSIAFVERGYQRSMFSFNSCIHPHKDKGATFFNQRRNWNELASVAMVSTIIYTPEKLACHRRTSLEQQDPLDEILFRMDAMITLERMVHDAPEVYTLGDSFRKNSYTQLCLYALWQAFLAYKRGDIKTAEDCFLFTRVIDINVTKQEYWQKMEKLLSTNDSTSKDWLDRFFLRQETTQSPKWSLSRNIFERWYLQLRRYCSQDKSTALAEK